MISQEDQPKAISENQMYIIVCFILPCRLHCLSNVFPSLKPEHLRLSQVKAAPDGSYKAVDFRIKKSVPSVKGKESLLPTKGTPHWKNPLSCSPSVHLTQFSSILKTCAESGCSVHSSNLLLQMFPKQSKTVKQKEKVLSIG